MEDKTILIIEDEVAYTRILSEKLKSAGFSVLTASNGKDGLEIALDAHPDLILLDLVMPQMGGIETLKLLRKDAWGNSARVIVLTALGDSKTLAEILDLKVFEYLIKDDNKIEDVVGKVRGYLA